MPIDSTEFEEMEEGSDGVSMRERADARRIIAFLLNNLDHAYRPVEIAGSTEIEETHIGVILGRLEERDVVRHKDVYYTIDPDALNRFQMMHQTMETVDKRYPREDKSEWDKYAVEQPE